MKNIELWEPCPGWEELYEVSSSGRVRDLKTKEIKKQYPNNKGKYLAVTLSGLGRSVPTRVHRLVAKAFIDNPSNKPLVLHRNDNGLDNCVDNLYWGTKSDNTYDAIRNGKHPHANKTHCKRGHEFTTKNTKITRDGRVCRKCIKLLEEGG